MPWTNRVLVVDDEPAIRALVAKIVQRAGLQVETARDGAEAIARIDSDDEFSVLVIDLMMPVIDGYGVIDHVRARGGRRPAIIVITAGDSSSIRRLDGSMVHSVIRKPFDIDVLGDLIVAAAQTMAAEEGTGSNVLDFSRRGSGKV